MKIYFAASMTHASKENKRRYGLIVRKIENLKHQLLTKRPANLKVNINAKHWVPSEVFKHQASLVEQAELMIAEVTQPSWGTAFLMEHALDQGVPVLALFYKNAESKLPMMIQGHPDLYVDHYNQDNLPTVLRKNLDYFKRLKKQKGKLIVIDGSNGSGKATQTAKLLKYFKKQRLKAKLISFPRYYSSFHGRMVGRFLTGEFGGLDEVNPYLSSLTYALDRLTARDEIVDWLKEGNMVVADRYITSSLAHQAVKLPPHQRKKFSKWIYEMEYKEHRMPKENIVIYLYVPSEISDKLILQKAKAYRGKKKRDIEEGLAYQRKVVKMYLQLCRENKHWLKVNCVNQTGKLLSIEAVHQLVLTVLKEKKIIS
ncbi:hypothetical protein KJ965_02760 [Patescibacteria group bacterium]|nr:hypothetical protein [Patescibacteria group bacterium]